MKRKRFYYILLFLVLHTISSWAQTAVEYNKQGLHYLDPHVLIMPLAAKNFLNAILLDSNKAEYHNNFGEALLKANLDEYSIPSFTHAIHLDSNYTVAYFNRGKAYMTVGEYESALPDLQKAVALQSDKRIRNYYQTEFVDKAKLEMTKPITDYIIPHYKAYKILCYALYLNEKWLQITDRQIFWTANHSAQYQKPEKSQWATVDYKKMKKSFPFSRVQAEWHFLEAAAVIYYLDKINKGKPKEVKQDSIAHYIHLKTNQVFYTAAILYKHYLSDENGYSKTALLKKCSAERAEGLNKLLPYITALDQEPGQYHREVANLPYMGRPWMDKSLTIPKPPPIYNPATVQDASCADKQKMVGYMYDSPYPLRSEEYYVLDFSCAKNSFLVLRVFREPYKNKFAPWPNTEFVWMQEKDFRVGYKNTGRLSGKNYRVCDKCNGYHYADKVVGGGRTYTRLHTDYFNPQNNVYSGNFSVAPTKTIWVKCPQCAGSGWLAD